MSTLRTHSLEELMSPAPASESLPLPPQTPPLPLLRAPRGLTREGAAPARARGRAELRPLRPAAGPTSSRAAGGSRAGPTPTAAPRPSALPASRRRAGKSRSAHQTFLLPSSSAAAGPRAAPWLAAGAGGADGGRKLGNRRLEMTYSRLHSSPKMDLAHFPSWQNSSF